MGCKDPHIGLAVGVAGLDGDNSLDGAADGNAGVSSVVAISVAGQVRSRPSH